jgi:hypothetical protein
MSAGGASARARLESMSVGVIDAGVAIALDPRRHAKSKSARQALYRLS